MLDLHVLWDDLARRHKSTSGQPKPTGFQLFNRVADELARTLLQIDIEALRELDQLQGSFSGSPAICTGCGAGNLQHFYRSKVEVETLCATCFQERKAGTGDLLKKYREKRMESRERSRQAGGKGILSKENKNG